MTFVGSPEYTGGNVGEMDNSGANKLFLIGVNVTSSGSLAGGMIGWINDSSNITMTMRNAHTNYLPSSGFAISGGLAARLIYSKNFKGSMINSTMISSKASNHAGGGLGVLSRSTATLDMIDSEVDVQGIDAAGGAIGELVYESELTLTQIGMGMKVTSTQSENRAAATIGGYKLNPPNFKYNFRLISAHGDANLRACGRGITASGIVDTANYPFDQSSCGHELRGFNTTRPNDWQQAQQAFCSDADCSHETTCHYPHEQPIIQPTEHSTHLIGRTKDGLLLIRELNNAEADPQAFASASNDTVLPEDPAVWGQWENNRLVTLSPKGENGTVLTRVSLDPETGKYHGKSAFIGGRPLHTAPGHWQDSYEVWTLETNNDNSRIERYQVDFSTSEKVTLLSEYSPAGGSVKGVKADGKLVYTALHNGTQLIIERRNRITTKLVSPPVALPIPDKLENVADSIFNLQIKGDRIYFLPQGYDLAEDPALTQHYAAIPEHGGCALWDKREIPFVTISSGTTDSKSLAGGVLGGVGAALSSALLAGYCYYRKGQQETTEPRDEEEPVAMRGQPSH